MALVYKATTNHGVVITIRRVTRTRIYARPILSHRHFCTHDLEVGYAHEVDRAFIRVAVI